MYGYCVDSVEDAHLYISNVNINVQIFKAVRTFIAVTKRFL